MYNFNFFLFLNLTKRVNYTRLSKYYHISINIKLWGSACFVNVPDEISKKNVDKIEQYLCGEQELRALSSKDSRSSEVYLRVLELHDILKSYEEKLRGIYNTDHKFSTSLIPSMSKHFEENNEWENLLELDKHQDLISMVNQKNRNATLRRIEKAKAKTAE